MVRSKPSRAAIVTAALLQAPDASIDEILDSLHTAGHKAIVRKDVHSARHKLRRNKRTLRQLKKAVNGKVAVKRSKPAKESNAELLAKKLRDGVQQIEKVERMQTILSMARGLVSLLEAQLRS